MREHSLTRLKETSENGGPFEKIIAYLSLADCLKFSITNKNFHQSKSNWLFESSQKKL